MRRKHAVHLLAITAVAGLVAACGSSAAGTAGASSGGGSGGSCHLPAVKVGGVLELTGALANYGNEQKNGMQLALRDLETAGTLPKGAVQIVYGDTASNADTYPQVVTKLVRSDNVSVLTGFTQSAGTLRLGQIVEGARVPAVVFGAQADKVSSQGAHWYQTQPRTQDVFGNAVPKIVNLLGLKGKTIGEVYAADGPTNVPYNTLYQQDFAAAGVKVVAETTLTTATDYSAPLTKLRGDNISALITNVPVPAQLAIQARQLKITVPIIGDLGQATQPVLDEAAGALEGAIIPAVWAASKNQPESQAFAREYRQAYHQEPSDFAAAAYDAMHLIAAALDKACSADPNAIQSALTTIIKRSVPTILGAGTTMTFDATRHAQYAPLILKVEHNTFVQVG